MPTLVSQTTLDELCQLIVDACEKGDNCSAIAERAGVARQLISSLKNFNYPNSPTLDKVEAILRALGRRVAFPKA